MEDFAKFLETQMEEKKVEPIDEPDDTTEDPFQGTEYVGDRAEVSNKSELINIVRELIRDGKSYSEVKRAIRNQRSRCDQINRDAIVSKIDKITYLEEYNIITTAYYEKYSSWFPESNNSVLFATNLDKLRKKLGYKIRYLNYSLLVIGYIVIERGKISGERVRTITNATNIPIVDIVRNARIWMM
jgi:hypothetical protein